MFGGSEVWWGGLLIFVVFLLVNLIIFLLRNKPKVCYVIIFCVAVYFLITKTVEYVQWQLKGRHLHFPVEISALAYFIFGITVVFRIKKLNAFASFVAVIAGLVYSVTFWFLPEKFIQNGQFHDYLIKAIINHHLLYLSGMFLTINIEKFEKKSIIFTLIGVGGLVLYSWLIHLFTDYSIVEGKPVIIEITDGTILDRVFTSYPAIAKVVYFICALALFLLILFGFYLLNAFSVKRRVKSGLKVDCYPESYKQAFTFKRTN